MQLFLIIALLATFVIADNSPAEPVTGVGLRCALVALCMAVTPLLAMCGSVVISRGIGRESATASRWMRAFSRFKQILLVFWLAVSLGSLYFFDWTTIVRHNWHLEGWFLVDKLLILLPVLVPLVLCWAAFYEVERAVEIWIATAQDAPLPPFRRASYLALQARHYFGLCVLPVLVVAAIQDAMAIWAPRVADELPPVLVYAPPLLILMIAFPWLLRVIWQTTKLPAGHLRSRLEATAAQAGLRLRDIFIWHTDGHVLNAAVAGFLPRLRFVFLTDGLLNRLSEEEVVAAFAHEVGHVRYRHLLLRLGVLAAPIFPWMCWSDHSPSFFQGTHVWLESLGTAGVWIEAGLLPVLLLAYVGLALGWYSRLLEYEADLWASGLGFDSPRDPLAVHYFTSTLARLASSTGMDRRKASWLHPSINCRIEFLQQVALSPAFGRRFQQRIRWISAVWVLLTLFACGLPFVVG